MKKVSSELWNKIEAVIRKGQNNTSDAHDSNDYDTFQRLIWGYIFNDMLHEIIDVIEKHQDSPESSSAEETQACCGGGCNTAENKSFYQNG